MSTNVRSLIYIMVLMYCLHQFKLYKQNNVGYCHLLTYRCFVLKAKLQECVELLDAFKKNQLPEGITNKDLWEAQKVKQVHNVHIFYGLH